MKSLLAIPSVFAALQTWPNGPSFDITYDTTKSKLKLDASVPDGQYLAVAWGRGMINTDIVFLPGSSTDGLKDLYATSYSLPSDGEPQDYSDTVKTFNNGVHNYTTYRARFTGDSMDGPEIECGKNHLFAWVGSSTTSSKVKHDKTGKFELELAADCSVLKLCKDGDCPPPPPPTDDKGDDKGPDDKGPDDKGPDNKDSDDKSLFEFELNAYTL